MTDFSKTLFHCSTLGFLMADPGGKSPIERLADAKKTLQTAELRYKAIKNKETKGTYDKYQRILKLRRQVDLLEDKKADEVLSDGAKTYLTKVYAWEKYKKWTFPEGKAEKFFAKGVAVEGAAIKMLSELDGKEYKKNETKIRNQFVVGIPDIYEGRLITEAEYIIDAKSSWDIGTFFANLCADLKEVYWWQMQGYFFLTGAQRGEVSYCLLSTPEHIIRPELERIKVLKPDYTDKDILWNFNFDSIPMDERRIKFEVERDDEAIERIKKRVVRCREFLAEIEQMHTAQVPAMNGL